VQNNIYLQAEGERLRLVATDLEFIGIDSFTTASVTDEGAVTVPARIFTEVIGNLGGDQVQLRADERNTLEILAAAAEYSIRGLPAEDFEMLPELADPLTFSLPQSQLAQVIEQIVFAVSADETRPNLTGALIELRPEHLEIIATDTHRLSWRKVEVATGLSEPRSVIVSARALHEIFRVLHAEADEPVQLSFSDTQVQVTVGETKIGSRLIEGQFPSYQKVIPDGFERRVQVRVDHLREACRRAVIVAREDANRIILRTAGTTMELTADSQDVGKAREEIPIELEGEDIEIAFNARYLADVLEVVKTDTVDFELSGPLNPGVVRQTGDMDYLYVLMPMQIL